MIINKEEQKMKQIYIWNLLATRLIYVSYMERPKCKPLSCEIVPSDGEYWEAAIK